MRYFVNILLTTGNVYKGFFKIVFIKIYNPISNETRYMDTSYSLVRYVRNISEIKNVCPISFYCFFTSLARHTGVEFSPPLNLVFWHIQNGRYRNHMYLAITWDLA